MMFQPSLQGLSIQLQICTSTGYIKLTGASSNGKPVFMAISEKWG